MRRKKIVPNKINIPKHQDVFLKYLGQKIDLTYLSHHNSEAHTLKISADQYLDVGSGEIKNYQRKAKKRLEAPGSVRKTMNRLRDLIYANVTDYKKIRWVTLTYKENMKSGERLYEDFRRFFQRFKRRCIKNSWGVPEYIAVAEPQQRGAWHLHVIFIFSDQAPFIPNKELEKLWGQGFTKIQALNANSDIALYLTAYLSDLEIDLDVAEAIPPECVKWISSEGKKKAILKGARLSMYPANMNIYRCSRGIKKPVVEKIPYKEALEILVGKQVTYEFGCKLIDEENGFETLMLKREYK